MKRELQCRSPKKSVSRLNTSRLISISSAMRFERSGFWRRWQYCSTQPLLCCSFKLTRLHYYLSGTISQPNIKVLSVSSLNLGICSVSPQCLHIAPTGQKSISSFALNHGAVSHLSLTMILEPSCVELQLQ